MTRAPALSASAAAADTALPGSGAPTGGSGSMPCDPPASVGTAEWDTPLPELGAGGGGGTTTPCPRVSSADPVDWGTAPPGLGAPAGGGGGPLLPTASVVGSVDEERTSHLDPGRPRGGGGTMLVPLDPSATGGGPAEGGSGMPFPPCTAGIRCAAACSQFDILYLWNAVKGLIHKPKCSKNVHLNRL